MKNSLFAALFILPASLSITCQAEPLTRRFVVRLQQDAGSPNQNFSIKCDLHTESCKSSGIAETNSYAVSDSPYDRKTQNRCKNKVLKTPISAAFLSALLLLSIVCQAKTLTRRCVVELQQDAGSLIGNFFIKRDLNTLSFTPSDIVGTNGYSGSIFRPDNKPHRLGSYGLKTSFIESISWQLIYGTNLLVAYELVLSTRAAAMSTKPYSWTPVEALVVVGWLLKSYWNSDSPLSDPIEQLKASQDDPFAISAMMLPGQNQQQNGQQDQPSAVSGQQASGATTTQLTGFLTSPLSSDSGDGNGDPEQHQKHTFGLNCYVDSCHGVCGLRSSFRSREPAEVLLNCEESSSGHTGATSGQSSHPRSEIQNNAHIQNNFRGQINQQEHGPASPTLYQTDSRAPDITRSRRIECDVIMVAEDGQRQRCGKVFRTVQGRSLHVRRSHCVPKFCYALIILNDGRRRPCEMSFRNQEMLSRHRTQCHIEPAFCDLIVVGEDSEQRVCGKVYRNIAEQQGHSLLNHEGEWDIRWSHPGRRDHIIGSHFCDMAGLVDDGEGRQVWQLCGRIFITLDELYCHRSGYHQN